MQARSKQCMIGPAEINMKLPVGGLGRAASPPAGSGAETREPNAFQQKYNENGFKLLTIGGELACCRTVTQLYTPKSDCVVYAVKQKLRPAQLLVRPKPDQPDRLLRPCYVRKTTAKKQYSIDVEALLSMTVIIIMSTKHGSTNVV